jgi:hypothetical protein
MMSADACPPAELKARLVALESAFSAFKELMNERDKRYEQRSSAQDTAVESALATSKEAVNKAETATERRLEVLNELRGVVVDQSREFSRKSEVDLLVNALGGRIDTLTSIVNTQQAHGGGIKDAFGYVVAGAGLLLAGIAIYFRH